MSIYPKIHSIEDLNHFKDTRPRILVLFSGGLDGAYLLYYMKHQLGLSPTALTINVGGDEDTQQAKQVCDKIGVESVILDKRLQFAQEFVLPALWSQSTYLGTHPISASLSRPLLAKCGYDYAIKNGFSVIIHTANRSQNSLRRFNGALTGLEFQGIFGTPYENTAITRAEKQSVLKQFGITNYQTRLHSVDSNIWCREFESGDMDDPENIPLKEEYFKWSRSDSHPKDTSLFVEFENGIPTSVNQEKMEFVFLINHLHKLAGPYGLGRYIGLEELESGIKVQEVREMPGAYVLLDAYKRLESGIFSSEVIREKMCLEQIWVREAVEGRWFNPLREAAQAFIQSISQKVTGVAHYQLMNNRMTLLGIKVDKPLYVRSRENFEEKLIEQELEIHGLKKAV